VVPTAIVGTQKARNWKRLQFPKVTVQYGDPVRFEQVDDPTPEQQQAAAQLIFDRVKALYEGLRDGGRQEAVEAARAARRAGRKAAGREPVAP
jgi:1-acyl-sn-glycerol-3-phosphate acyltransferase